MRGDPIDPLQGGRPTCYACMRPTSHCICSLVTSITAHCNVLILQHPHEWKKYYNTAKLVARSLTNARVMRGVFFEESSIVSALEGQQPYLLYPGAESIDCQEVHLDSTSTVIVIDGTWSEAGKIVFRNPLLQRFPRISFKTTLESNYRIRKQPKRGYLSTIESIGHLLQLNARANGLLQQADSYDVLFSAFSKMVDQQLNYFPRMHKGNSTKI